MGRIRSIKPEFVQSESMGRVSREGRLLFILLWTVADDSGRTRAASRMLASLLYPYDDDAPSKIGIWLTELEAEGCIDRYSIDGSTYLQIRNWCKHQKIDKPSASKIPPFDESSRILANPRESSTTDQDQDLDQERDLGSGKDHRARREASAKPDDLTDEVWTDWVKHRKAIKAPVTKTVLDQFRKEAAKAGITLSAALVEAMARGWRGFKADWVKGKTNNHQTDFGAVDYHQGVSDDGRF